MGNDALAFKPEPDQGLSKLLSWSGVIQGLASQATGAPWGLFGTPAADLTAADGWTLALWCGDAVPLAYDSVFTFATGGLARYTADLGPVLDTGIGFGLIGLGIVTCFEQKEQGSPYTGWDIANSIVPQFDRLFKFLLLTKDDPEAAAVALPVLLTVDLVLGIGATVTQVGDAVAG